MLYELFRIPLLILFFSYYRRIYWANASKVPKGVPIVIISNHSTAFVEQILVAAFLRRPIYFWARSSVFPKNPLVSGFMKGVHMMPIKRSEEGMKNPKENDATMKESYKQLLEGKALYIAPEGNCVMEKRLRPFRTGTARVALGAAAERNFNNGLCVVPVGVNYTHHRWFRSEVMVCFGEAIPVKEYGEQYINDPQRAARILTIDMREALIKEVIHIESEEDEIFCEQLFELFRNERNNPIKPRFSTKNSRFEMEKSIADFVNSLHPELKLSLKEEAELYFSQLDRYGLKDAMFSSKQKMSFNAFVTLIFGTVPAFLGYLFGYIPYISARHYRNKMMTSENMQQFYAPLAIAFSLVSWMIYSILIVGSTAWLLGCWSLGLPPLMAYLKYWQIKYLDYFDLYKMNRKFNKFRSKKKDLTVLLEKERSVLIAKISKNLID